MTSFGVWSADERGHHHPDGGAGSVEGGYRQRPDAWTVRPDVFETCRVGNGAVPIATELRGHVHAPVRRSSRVEHGRELGVHPYHQNAICVSSGSLWWVDVMQRRPVLLPLSMRPRGTPSNRRTLRMRRATPMRGPEMATTHVHDAKRRTLHVTNLTQTKGHP